MAATAVRMATIKLDEANNTIVTAFFRTPTKRHSLDEYFALMRRLFSCDDAMVIFTSEDLAANISALRGKPTKTMIITMNLNETRMAKLHDMEYWQKWSPALHARGAHYTSLWVWNEKVEFLKKASDRNPFQSTFFAWVDAGFVRYDDYSNTTLLQRIPPELGKDQMMVLNVTRVTHKQKTIMMGAGLFGGYNEGITRFHEKFYKLVEEGRNSSHKNIGSEQHLMYETCVSTKGLCFTVRPGQRGNGGRFAMFYMLPFLNLEHYKKMKLDGLIQKEFGEYTQP